MLPQETRPCLLETEKKRIFCFFPSAIGMVLLPLEALLCFRERHARASWSRTEKQNTFSFFSFRQRYSFASTRGTIVLLREIRMCLLKTENKTFFSFRKRHGTHPILFLDRWSCMRPSQQKYFIHACMLSGWLVSGAGPRF